MHVQCQLTGTTNLINNQQLNYKVTTGYKLTIITRATGCTAARQLVTKLITAGTNCMQYSTTFHRHLTPSSPIAHPLLSSNRHHLWGLGETMRPIRTVLCCVKYDIWAQWYIQSHTHMTSSPNMYVNTSQETGSEECVQNKRFCVKWDVKLALLQFLVI